MAMDKEKKAKKMVSLINNGSFVEEAAKKVGISVSTAYRYLDEHYPVKRETYANLLATSRRNKRARKKEQKALSYSMTDKAKLSKQNEVIVMETGYMLATGVAGILNESLDIYVPFFCIKELDKLSNFYQMAREIMTMHWSTRRIVSINLRGNEKLYVEPTYFVKDRSRGVIATCVELDSKGFKVRLLTNSMEIERLARLQKCDIDVIRIASSK